MSAGNDAALETFDSDVEADHPVAEAREPVYLRPGQNAEHTNSLGLIVTTSLFFVLLAAAIMFGGHAAIAPLLRQAVGHANGTGDVVYMLPDGVFCRHLSYDNSTGDMIENGVERCPEHIGHDVSAASGEFRWGAH